MNYNIYKPLEVDQHFLGMLLKINPNEQMIVIRGNKGSGALMTKYYRFYSSIAINLMTLYNKLDGKVMFSASEAKFAKMGDCKSIKIYHDKSKEFFGDLSGFVLTTHK